MPIKIQKDLPAKAILESENIFVMDEDRAMSQDIRPLEIFDSEPDADQGGYGDAASAGTFEYAAAGGLFIPDAGNARFEKYIADASE